MVHNVAQVEVVLVCKKGDAARMKEYIENLFEFEAQYIPDFLGLEIEIKNVTSHKAMKVGDVALRELSSE